jgi:predicted RNA-binding protein YlxR (DUF448 family)
LIELHRQPIRTCVGCGRKAPQPELVRLKAEAGSVVVDRAHHGGRGAWLHPALACLDRALQRRVFPRALRAQGVHADAATLGVELTGNARKN